MTFGLGGSISLFLHESDSTTLNVECLLFRRSKCVIVPFQHSKLRWQNKTLDDQRNTFCGSRHLAKHLEKCFRIAQKPCLHPIK